MKTRSQGDHHPLPRRLANGVLLLLLVAPLLGLSNCGGPNLNFAAAFGWRGLVDTDVRFGEFFGSDHTLALRFMPQYPAAYTGPLIASDTDGPGSFFVGMGELVVASGEVGSDKIRLQLPTVNAPSSPGSASGCAIPRTATVRPRWRSSHRRI